METKDRVAINKSTFVARYALVNGISKTKAAVEVDNFLTAMYRTLAGGEGVKLPGFGCFLLKHRNSMATKFNFGDHAGETMIIPERYALSFEPADALKRDIKKIAVD